MVDKFRRFVTISPESRYAHDTAPFSDGALHCVASDVGSRRLLHQTSRAAGVADPLLQDLAGELAGLSVRDDVGSGSPQPR